MKIKHSVNSLSVSKSLSLRCHPERWRSCPAWCPRLPGGSPKASTRPCYLGRGQEPRCSPQAVPRRRPPAVPRRFVREEIVLPPVLGLPLAEQQSGFRSRPRLEVTAAAGGRGFVPCTTTQGAVSSHTVRRCSPMAASTVLTHNTDTARPHAGVPAWARAEAALQPATASLLSSR